jgi:hypothetical protein
MLKIENIYHVDIVTADGRTKVVSRKSDFLCGLCVKKIKLDAKIMVCTITQKTKDVDFCDTFRPLIEYGYVHVDFLKKSKIKLYF